MGGPLKPPDRDLCASCGNQFPEGQVCDACRARTARGTSVSRLAIFGSVDGLTMFLGLALGLIVSSQTASAVWHAALGGAAGELVGMTSGQWLSDRASGFRIALGCGLAGAVACILPGIPYLFLTSPAALGSALLIAWGEAGVIAWVRPEHGLTAVLDTYGILIGAGLLSGLTGLL